MGQSVPFPPTQEWQRVQTANTKLQQDHPTKADRNGEARSRYHKLYSHSVYPNTNYNYSSAATIIYLNTSLYNAAYSNNLMHWTRGGPGRGHRSTDIRGQQPSQHHGAWSRFYKRKEGLISPSSTLASADISGNERDQAQIYTTWKRSITNNHLPLTNDTGTRTKEGAYPPMGSMKLSNADRQGEN
uniref:Uncharacterized protein n=1 Tax=Knipowitschia caucasica TaxID=637954 RepID=A0AAV2LM62_KNICA